VVYRFNKQSVCLVVINVMLRMPPSIVDERRHIRFREAKFCSQRPCVHRCLYYGEYGTVRDDDLMESERRIHLWGRDSLYVDVRLLSDGTLIFEGQDLNPANPWSGAEYEYVITVEAADVPRVVAALGGVDGDDVLALLKADAERIVGIGERTWLRSLGIEPGFWSRVGD
jgi:hypothetical protein